MRQIYSFFKTFGCTFPFPFLALKKGQILLVASTMQDLKCCKIKRSESKEQKQALASFLLIREDNCYQTLKLKNIFVHLSEICCCTEDKDGLILMLFGKNFTLHEWSKIVVFYLTWTLLKQIRENKSVYAL